MNILEKLNLRIVLPTLLICSFSLISLFSFNPALAQQQLLFIILGLATFLVLATSDFNFFKIYAWHLYAALLLFLVVTIVFGDPVKGSVRWIDIAFFRFQPSEFGKIAIILILAVFLASSKKAFTRPINLLKLAFIIMAPTLLVLLQPDLGTALVYLLILGTLLLVSRVPKILIIGGFIVLGLVSPLMWHSLKDYQQDRVLVFLNPLSDPLGAGYNSLQARIAVGSGMVFGKGFGSGTQSKLRFLPESQTDFIFASFSEEWGLLGVLILISLYLILLLEILKIANNASSKAQYLFAIGAFGLLFFQTFINICVNVGLLPVTGITLPLMSYGGSSMVSTFIVLGIVNGIHSRSLKY